MTININTADEEFQQQIIQAYQNGMSLRQIQNNFNVNRQTTAHFLEKRKIKTTKGNHHRTYNHNENFFENIDTEQKAYWLGFMFADGYISNNDNRYGQDQFGISLAEQDIELLYKFKTAINATNPIHTYYRKEGTPGQPMCRIFLTSQKTVNDLISHGCVKQKSHILQPPIGVPEELIPHFIRGFFDGDGSISKYKQSEDKNIYLINFTTTKDMAIWLKNYFKKGSVYKEKRREHTFYYSLGGHLQIIKFYHMLYDNASVYLQRKKDRFEELTQKYSEN